MTHLGRALSVRPGEGRLVGLVAAVFASIEIARGFGEIAADSLVIGRFGSGSLPWLFIGLGITSLVAALAFGAVLGRLRRGSLVAPVSRSDCWSRHSDLNRGPAVYETAALPLSYVGAARV